MQFHQKVAVLAGELNGREFKIELCALGQGVFTEMIEQT